MARFLGISLVARIATESTSTAILLVTIATLDDPALGSMLVAVVIATAAITGPVSGSLLDRTMHPIRSFSVMIAVLCAGFVGLALLIGHAPVPLLIAFAILAGLGYPGVIAAWTAQLPRLVQGDLLTRGYAADAGMYSIGSVLGPPLAAATLVLTASGPLLVPAALLVLAMVLLPSVPLRAREAGPVVPLLANLRAGFATLFGRPRLRRAVVISTITLSGQMALVITAPIKARELTGDIAFAGVILGTFAAGAVVTSLLATRFPIRRPDRMMVLCTLGSAAALLAFDFVPGITWVLLSAALMGMCDGPLMTSGFLIRARESTDQVRTQVFTTAAALKMLGAAIASAVFGALLGIGITTVILVGVLLHLVGLLLGWLAGLGSQGDGASLTMGQTAQQENR
ncbi:MAG: MFS transporter [Actinomycetales bacterium]|nr:MFS transporter [Actinomycetales bacterium]